MLVHLTTQGLRRYSQRHSVQCHRTVTAYPPWVSFHQLIHLTTPRLLPWDLLRHHIGVVLLQVNQYQIPRLWCAPIDLKNDVTTDSYNILKPSKSSSFEYISDLTVSNDESDLLTSPVNLITSSPCWSCSLSWTMCFYLLYHNTHCFFLLHSDILNIILRMSSASEGSRDDEKLTTLI